MRVCAYDAWAADAAKPRALTTKQIFGEMQRQIRGCSENRAQVLLELFATPALAVDFFVPGNAGNGASTSASSAAVSSRDQSQSRKAIIASLALCHYSSRPWAPRSPRA